MKVTLGQVFGALTVPQNPETGEQLKDDDGKPILSPIERLALEADKGKCCVRTKLDILNLNKKLRDEVESGQKLRTGLFEKYGEKGENGDTRVDPESENFQPFVDAMNELMAQEVKIDMDPVVLPPENQEITINTLATLDGLYVMRGADKQPLKIVDHD